MKASTYIKSHGLPSLAHVAKMTGWHRDTIQGWYRSNFSRFEIVVAGCVEMQKKSRK